MALKGMHRDLVWTLRQPSIRHLARRCRSRPHKHTGTHDTLERGFEADPLTDARWDLPGAGSNLPSLRRGSGYEQAKAKLRRIEIDEFAVAFGPPA